MWSFQNPSQIRHNIATVKPILLRCLCNTFRPELPNRQRVATPFQHTKSPSSPTGGACFRQSKTSANSMNQKDLEQIASSPFLLPQTKPGANPGQS